MQDLAVVTINVLAWFLHPFAFLVVTAFVVSLFRKD